MPTTAPESDVTTVSVMLTSAEIEQRRRRAKEHSAFAQKEFRKTLRSKPQIAGKTACESGHMTPLTPLPRHAATGQRGQAIIDAGPVSCALPAMGSVDSLGFAVGSYNAKSVAYGPDYPAGELFVNGSDYTMNVRGFGG